MTDQIQPSPKGETQVRDLTSEQLDRVTGGELSNGGILVALGDGSVRNTDSGDYATWRTRFGSTL